MVRFSYTPDADFFGSDEFTYFLSDGLLESASATVQLEVASVNDPPRATADAYVSLVDQPLEVTAEERSAAERHRCG